MFSEHFAHTRKIIDKKPITVFRARVECADAHCQFVVTNTILGAERPGALSNKADNIWWRLFWHIVPQKIVYSKNVI